MRALAYFLAAIIATYMFHLRNESSYWHAQTISYQKESEENARYAEEKRHSLQECEAANYDLTESLDYTRGQNQYVIEKGQQLWKRLQATTDLLESALRCGLYKMDLEHCMPTKLEDVKKWQQDNRKANF